MREFRHEVVVTRVTRRANSYNGNPSYEIYTDSGVFRTETDAALNYDIDNVTSSRNDVCIIDRPVTLVTTKARRVFRIEMDGKVIA